MELFICDVFTVAPSLSQWSLEFFEEMLLKPQFFHVLWNPIETHINDAIIPTRGHGGLESNEIQKKMPGFDIHIF